MSDDIDFSDVPAKIIRIAATSPLIAVAIDENRNGHRRGPGRMAGYPPDRPLEDLVDIAVNNRIGLGLTSAGEVIHFGNPDFFPSDLENTLAPFQGETVSIRMSDWTVALMNRSGHILRLVTQDGRDSNRLFHEKPAAAPHALATLHTATTWQTAGGWWFYTAKTPHTFPKGDVRSIQQGAGGVLLEKPDRSWEFLRNQDSTTLDFSEADAFLADRRLLAVTPLGWTLGKNPGIGFIAIAGPEGEAPMPEMTSTSVEVKVEAGVPPEMTALKKLATARWKAQVSGVTTEAVKTLDARYQVAIEEGLAAAFAKGDLDAAAELREELNRINDGGAYDPEASFKSATAGSLFGTYRAARAEIAAGEVALSQAARKQLETELEVLEMTLTKTNRIEEALRVREFRSGDEIEAFFGEIGGKPDAALATRETIRIEGESLISKFSATRGEASIRKMKIFRGEWSGGSQLWWKRAAPGDTAKIILASPGPGNWRLSILLTTTPDYGKIRVIAGGEEKEVDLYSDRVTRAVPVILDLKNLPASGPLEVVIKMIGKHPDAKPNHIVGIDAFEMIPD